MRARHFMVALILAAGLGRAGAAAPALGGCPPLFAEATHYPAGAEPASVAIGDLNGDQVPDLAVANEYSDDVSVVLGIGDGTFTGLPTTPPATSAARRRPNDDASAYRIRAARSLEPARNQSAAEAAFRRRPQRGHRVLSERV